MVHKAMLVAAVLGLVALAGCTSGSDGGSSDDGTTTGDGGGVGGNVTVGNGTASGNVSASYSMTNSSTNGSAPVAENAEVSIEDNAFVNSTVTIRVGGTVTWVHNDGATAHTVTADDASFDSSPNCSPPLTLVGDCMTQGDEFSWQFTTAGTYTYHCKVHGSMTGTVQVVA